MGGLSDDSSFLLIPDDTPKEIERYRARQARIAEFNATQRYAIVKGEKSPCTINSVQNWQPKTICHNNRFMYHMLHIQNVQEVSIVNDYLWKDAFYRFCNENKTVFYHEYDFYLHAFKKLFEYIEVESVIYRYPVVERMYFNLYGDALWSGMAVVEGKKFPVYRKFKISCFEEDGEIVGESKAPWVLDPKHKTWISGIPRNKWQIQEIRQEYLEKFKRYDLSPL